MKRHAPATLRNREVILEVLREELPENAHVLEIAAGSGEHAVFFAEKLPSVSWLPTDPSGEALRSIAAYRAEAGLPNLQAPIPLDASERTWPIAEADAIVCINMVHISPWAASVGLFDGAARILRKSERPLILYGPFFEADTETAPSNREFDTSLRMRDGRWGLREVDQLDNLAKDNGFRRTMRYTMPANNLMLVYRPA